MGVTSTLLPGTPVSPGGDRRALDVPRANLRECSSSLEEGEALSNLGSRKAFWSRWHSDNLKGRRQESVSLEKGQLQQGLERGPGVTVWWPECKAKVCAGNTRGSALGGRLGP